MNCDPRKKIENDITDILHFVKYRKPLTCGFLNLPQDK